MAWTFAFQTVLIVVFSNSITPPPPCTYKILHVHRSFLSVYCCFTFFAACILSIGMILPIPGRDKSHDADSGQSSELRWLCRGHAQERLPWSFTVPTLKFFVACLPALPSCRIYLMMRGNLYARYGYTLTSCIDQNRRHGNDLIVCLHIVCNTNARHCNAGFSLSLRNLRRFKYYGSWHSKVVASILLRQDEVPFLWQ